MKSHQIIIILSFVTFVSFNSLRSSSFETYYTQMTPKDGPNSIDDAREFYKAPMNKSTINDAIKAQESEKAQKAASEQLPQFKNDTLDTSTSTGINTTQGKPDILAKKITKEFNSFINKQLFLIIRKVFQLNASQSILQAGLANVIIKSLAQFAFQLFHIPQHLDTPKNNSINNFKMQIQNLAQQIENYNTKTVYSNPDQMLMLIQFINQFLKENNVIYFGPTMFAKLNTVSKLANTTCDFFRNQNIILASKNAPQAILPFFQSVIENTNDLPNIQFSHQLMHAIYDTNGYMDQIIQTWEKFKKDDLYKNKLNRQYGAFLTFLLLFENSVVAAAIILDETSELYKVTNPIPVVINIG